MFLTYRTIEPTLKELGFLIGNITKQGNQDQDSEFESTTVSASLTVNDMIK